MGMPYFVYIDSLLGIEGVSLWRGGREVASDFKGNTDKAVSNSGRRASWVKSLGNHVKKGAVKNTANVSPKKGGLRQPWELSSNPWRAAKGEREGVTFVLFQKVEWGEWKEVGGGCLITALFTMIPAAYWGRPGIHRREARCHCGQCSSRGRTATCGRNLQTGFLHWVGGWNNNLKSTVPSNWKIWCCFLSYKTALLWPCLHEKFIAGKEQRSWCH